MAEVQRKITELESELVQLKAEFRVASTADQERKVLMLIREAESQLAEYIKMVPAQVQTQTTVAVEFNSCFSSTEDQAMKNADNATTATAFADFVTVNVLADTLLREREALTKALNQFHSRHCRGLQITGQSVNHGTVQCETCSSTVDSYYKCNSCNKPLCFKCFPLTMQNRITCSDSGNRFTYDCPYCQQPFRSFHQ